ncbi:MAG: hypothetical protein EXX96DRAFT_612057 [Benjaminiella poitrasii]|nr:MAG: hypothetical protein EXX96DRAFT_612057 [Benjaminiella poitrasii]
MNVQFDKVKTSRNRGVHCIIGNTYRSDNLVRMIKTLWLESNLHGRLLIASRYLTHGGRHSGTIESEDLGIPTDIIKHYGNWKNRLNRLESHYIGKLPSQFTRGVTGFWDKPFFIARNSVNPPLSLQKRVFLWIEDYFRQYDVAWKKECEKEMKESDKSGYVTLEIIQEIPQSESTCTESTRSKKKKASEVYSKVDTAKRGFLKLLTRCRRIILQDSAVFLNLKKENYIISSKEKP